MSEIASLVFDKGAESTFWELSKDYHHTGVDFYEEIINDGIGDYIKYELKKSCDSVDVTSAYNRAKVIEIYADEIIDELQSSLHGKRVRAPRRKSASSARVNIRRMF